MPFADKFVEVDGRKVGYVDEGEGAPLLLLHGAGFDHAELTWKPTVYRLRDRRRLIVPDLPGYGESEGFGRAHDLSELGRWTAAFLDAVGLERVDIAGVSMGGGMALWLAIHAPERVDRLIPCGAYGLMARAPLHPLAVGLLRSPVMDAVYYAAGHIRPVARIGLSQTYDRTSRVSDEDLADLMAVAREQSRRRSFDAFLKAEMRWGGLTSDLSGELPRIQAPTLLIQGLADRVVPARHSRRAATLIPNARLELMRTGHWPMREKPDAFASLLGGFLDGRPVGET